MKTDIELKLLKLSKDDLIFLPAFYSKIYYNEMIHPDDPSYRITFSEKLDSYIDLRQPSKLISKIVDFSKK